MIHLDSRNGEKEKIVELINSSIDKPEYELECLFYEHPTQIRNPNIKNSNFVSIVKRYKGNPNFISKTSERLAITFPHENPKYSNIRILIKGSGPIKNYCNNENLSLIRNNIDFEYKTKPKGLNTVDIINYNMRFNLKQEQNFNNDDAKINDLLRDINTISKNYRYKKIFSFEKKTKDFQIDVSIVKSSLSIDKFLSVKDIIEKHKLRDIVKPPEVKMSFHTWWDSIKDNPNEMVKISNSSNYFKTIKESQVFTNIPSYEVEVEYIKNKSIIPKFKNITERKEYVISEFGNFFKEIGSVLQCIQNTFYIISNDEKFSVKQQFTKVIENSINEKMLESNRRRDSKYRGGDGIEGRGAPAGKAFYKAKGGNYSLNEDNDLDFLNLSRRDDSEQDDNDNDNSMNGGSIKVIGGQDLNYNESVSHNNNESDNESDNDEDKEEDLDKTNNDNDNDNDNSNDEETNQIGGAKKIAELKLKIIKKLHYNIFFGPMIIDLLHNDANYIDPSSMPDPKTNTNIHINYLVTDKTDGERHLLFFDNTGKVYGIDRDQNVKYFGIIIPGLANSILDGEYINRSYEDKILNNFYIFDSYIYKGENVMIKPFLFSKKGGQNGRYDTILESIKAFNEGTNITQLNSRLPFLLYKKEYYLGDTPSSYIARVGKGSKQSLMSENCESILTKMNVKYGGFLDVGHLFPYKTDGLVFHPNQLSVFQKSMDDYIENPFQGGRWNNNYKWKSQNNLTIDFRINIIKEMGTSRPVYKYIGDTKFVVVHLMTSINKSSNPNNIDNNKLNFYLINTGQKIQNLPSEIPFFATNPFIGYYDSDGKEQNNMGEAYFEVDGNDNITCSDGSLITDGIICECAYDLSKEESFRWTPERLRADKTRPNAYITANTTWLLINKPITKSLLTGSGMSGMGGFPNTEGGSSGSSNTKTKPADAEKALREMEYYSTNQETEQLTKPLTKFNNFVKEYLIQRALTGYTKPNLMDLAVGSFGDMHKYVKYGVNHFIGLDINEHNLNNPRDGAATRMMKQISTTNTSGNNSQYVKFAEKMLLLLGTATKNISSGDCAADTINKYYLDVLYGRAKGNTTKLRKLEGVGLDGFDVITCMYAIHYMMNTETALDNFLRNVSENLLDQGYFVGTCLDGMEIIKELGSKTEINGNIDGKSVFFIRKESDDPNAYKNITVGNKITVFFETFNGSFSENLVNKSYLKEKAKTHNLKLVEFKPFLEEPGNMLSKYEADGDKLSKENVRNIRSSNAMMMWAKFNSYFIFQKVRGKD
jgi:hypothetical protein